MFARARQLSLRFPRSTPSLGKSLVPARFKRYEAFDAQLDHDALAEARAWHQEFETSQLPKGNTTYARSSGAGGQHVNKTETKAVTAYPVWEILAMLPKTLHSAEHRSRDMNLEDNHRKLMDEVQRMYRANVPAATSQDKKKKHEDIAKKFNENRLTSKKIFSAKKQSRRGPVD